MPHEEYKSDPWHVGRVDSRRDDIGSTCADDKGSESSPHVEEADEVEHRDGQQEDILLPWLFVRDPLQYGSQWIGQVEGGDKLDWVWSE